MSRRLRLSVAAAVALVTLLWIAPSAFAAQGITGITPDDGQTVPTATPTFTISTTGFDPSAETDNPFVGVSTSFQVGPDGTLANTYGCLFEATPTDPTSSTYVAASTPASWQYCPLQPGTTYYWQIWFYTADTSAVDQSLVTCSGVACHTKVMTLYVAPPVPAPAPAPDFRFQISPSSTSVAAPGAASFAISSQGLNGFNSTIQLVVSGLPPGASASWSSGTSAEFLTVTVDSSTPGGNYTLMVTGTGGGVTHTVSADLDVVAGAPPIPPPPPPNGGTTGNSVTRPHAVSYAPHLPSSAHFHGASVKQTRLSRAAYSLSKMLGVPKSIAVACWSTTDWENISGDNPESTYSILGFHLLSMPHWVDLSPGICRTFETLIYHRPTYPNVITANAVDTLTHEMIHALGVRNEAKTECFAMQLNFATGVGLGLPLRYAESLDRLSLRNYGKHPPSYINRTKCRENGAWDLFKNRPSLPWHLLSVKPSV